LTVSVIIPTYNWAGGIEKTIRCVLRQSISDLELIVVDDGSTDNTAAVVNSIEDKRLKFYHKNNEGPAAARNFGLDEAKCQYIAFLDHDDQWPENFLEVMTNALNKNPEYNAAYCNITLIKNDGTTIKSYKASKGKSGSLAKDLFLRGFIWTSATVMRAKALENCRYDPALNKSYEDGDFFLRFSLNNKFLFVKDIEVVKHQHKENLSEKVGIQPTRLLVLERFYYDLGGDKFISAVTARRRFSHAARKVAKANLKTSNRTAAVNLYTRAIKYWPFDIRLYPELIRALLLDPRKDNNPNWQMPSKLNPI